MKLDTGGIVASSTQGIAPGTRVVVFQVLIVGEDGALTQDDPDGGEQLIVSLTELTKLGVIT